VARRVSMPAADDLFRPTSDAVDATGTDAGHAASARWPTTRNPPVRGVRADGSATTRR
jgi:hypothetical protein